MDSFRSDASVCLECLCVCTELSPSHCAAHPHGRETTQSLSRPADLLFPIAQFYSLLRSFFWQYMKVLAAAAQFITGYQQRLWPGGGGQWPAGGCTV